MNARDDAHRTTVAVTSGLAVAALATTITVGLVVARTESADAATTDTSGTSDTGSSSNSTQSDQSTGGSTGSSGISPGSGSADATSGGS